MPKRRALAVGRVSFVFERPKIISEINCGQGRKRVHILFLFFYNCSVMSGRQEL